MCPATIPGWTVNGLGEFCLPVRLNSRTQTELQFPREDSMHKLSNHFGRRFAVVGLSLLAAGALQAQYVELGDAGVTLGSAQSTGPLSGVPLTSITGTILNGFDGDFFYITITNPTTFSATTVGGSSLDTMLYLFTLNGSPVYLNDDAPSGTSVQSNLPPGHALGPLSIGTYII